MKTIASQSVKTSFVPKTSVKFRMQRRITVSTALFLLILMTIISQKSFAQNGVVISTTTPTTVDGNAVLELQGTKGLLLPRLTFGTPSGTNGLMCYDATNGLFKFYQAGAWVALPTFVSPTFTGTVTMPTGLSGLAKLTSGVLSAATAGTDFENALTFSNGLIRTTNAIALGGTLTGATSIDNSTYALTLGSATATGIISLGLGTGTNSINIGSANPSSATQTINIGNGAAVTSGGVAVNIASGIPGTGTTNTVTIANGATVGNTSVSILSGTGTNGTGTLSLGNNTRVTTIDLGNIVPVAARTTTIAAGNSGVIDLINIGTGNASVAGGKTIHIGDGTPTGTNLITIGSSAAVASTTTIQGGNGTTAINLTPNTAGGIVIGASSGTGDITLGSSTATENVYIGNGVNAAAQTVNILSGVGTAGTGVLSMANNTRVTTIDLGNIAPAAARTVTIAGGNSAVADVVNIGTGLVAGVGSKTVNITTGASTTGINTVNIGTGATTVAGGNTIHIGDGTPTGSGTNLITIGSSVANSVTKIKSPLLRSIGAVVTSSAAQTLSGANMAKGAVFQLTGGAGYTFTLDNGTNLSTAVPGVAVGDMISFVVSNASTGTITMAGATGTTLANVMTVATLQSRTFYAINTGSNTWTIY